jgi:hypothetical protein
VLSRLRSWLHSCLGLKCCLSRSAPNAFSNCGHVVIRAGMPKICHSARLRLSISFLAFPEKKKIKNIPLQEEVKDSPGLVELTPHLLTVALSLHNQIARQLTRCLTGRRCHATRDAQPPWLQHAASAFLLGPPASIHSRHCPHNLSDVAYRSPIYVGCASMGNSLSGGSHLHNR